MKQRRAFDLVIIGADAPGLAAAACAARAGAEISLSVGVVRTGEESAPGPSAPGVPDFVWRRLDLQQTALSARPVPAAISLFEDGRQLSSDPDIRRTGRAFEAAGVDEAGVWSDYASLRLRAFAEADAVARRAAKGSRPLTDAVTGPDGARAALRLAARADETLDDFFADEHLKTHLAALALMPFGIAGDEPGSAAALGAALDAGAWRITEGDRGAGLMRALEDVCQSSGVVLIEGAVVAVDLVDDRSRLVNLDSGEALKAPVVMVSRAASPTAARLGAAPAFSPLARREGAGAEVRVRLAAPFAGMARADSICFAAGSRAALAAARDAAREGRIPDDPPIMFEIAGDEIVVHAPYLPAALYADDERREWSEQDRQQLGRAVVDRLGRALNGALPPVRRVDVRVHARETGRIASGPARLIAPPASLDEIGAAARLAMEIVRGD